MKIEASAPTRARVVQGELYEAAGQAGFYFNIPQPFTAEMFDGLRPMGISPAGLASQMNQVLAENLGNNIAARIKKLAKAGQPLPTQADMDALVEAYDFTGVRSSSVSIASPFDKIFFRIAASFVRKLLLKRGYQDMAAPVKVAKKKDEPGENEISYADFESEVAALMEGTGPWADKPAFIEARKELLDQAKAEEERLRAVEASTTQKLSTLDALEL
jgi:hypothetical protein